MEKKELLNMDDVLSIKIKKKENLQIWKKERKKGRKKAVVNEGPWDDMVLLKVPLIYYHK